MKEAVDIDKMLLDVRSDKYGDSGNYNTEKLKQAIQAELTKAVIEEVNKITNTELWTNPDGSSGTYYVPKEYIDKRLAELNQSLEEHK